MGGGGKGGSQQQQTQIPEWVKPYAEENLRLGQVAQRLGYMPYYGPDVAGYNPWDVAAAEAASTGAQAFGYAAPSKEQIREMYPQGPQSSGELFDQAMAELRARRPGQMAVYDAMFVNPTTGLQGVTTAQALEAMKPNAPASPAAAAPASQYGMPVSDQDLSTYANHYGFNSAYDLKYEMAQKGGRMGNLRLIDGQIYRV